MKRKISKKSKLLSLISILFGIIASIIFMLYWQYSSCPSPDQYGSYFGETMNLSEWLKFWEVTAVWWGPGALISLAILVVFVVLAIILMKIRFYSDSEILTELDKVFLGDEDELKLVKLERIRLLVSLIIAGLGFAFVLRHVRDVASRGYAFTEIFNFGTWMNQNLLVILGAIIFMELLVFLIFIVWIKKIGKGLPIKALKYKIKKTSKAFPFSKAFAIEKSNTVANETDDIKLF